MAKGNGKVAAASGGKTVHIAHKGGNTFEKRSSAKTRRQNAARELRRGE